MINPQAPRFVAIVGGSGSGKSWLTTRLQEHFGNQASCVSLDDFYRDRSELTPTRRNAVNFDHPKAIDWGSFQKWLMTARSGRPANLPRYDFKTHTRLVERVVWEPSSIIFVEGLWLLWRAAVRRLFDFTIFVDCPADVRLQRREARDVLERGRMAAFVRKQFRKVVAPMHTLYVAPQARWADMVLTHPVGEADVYRVAVRLTELLPAQGPWQATLDGAENESGWRAYSL